MTGWVGGRGLLTLGVIISLMVGCSGSGGGGSSAPAAQADTVAGVDANNNGVRDDVDQYLATTYADPAQAPTKAALTQYAQVLQSAIVDAASPTTTATAAASLAPVVVQHAQEMVDAIECLGATRPTDFAILESELRGVAVDTDMRQQAYLDAARLAEAVVNQVQFRTFETWAAACR